MNVKNDYKSLLTVALVLILSGVSAFGQSDTPKVDSLFSELKIAKHDTSRISIHYHLGRALRKKTPSIAKHHFGVALKLIDQNTTDSKAYYEDKFNILNGLGLIERGQGNLPQALDYYLSSYEFAEKSQEQDYISTSLFNIGTVYRYLEEFDKAEEYYKKSLTLRLKSTSIEGITNCYNVLGVLHRKRGNYVAAEEYYRKSLELALDSGIIRVAAHAYTNIGVIYSYKKEQDSAIHYFNKALAINMEKNDKTGIATCYLNIGNAHYKEERIDTAEAYYVNALSIYTGVRKKGKMSTVYRKLSVLYKKTGRYKEAFKAFENHIIYRDSVTNQEQTRKISQREAAFKYEKIITADSVKYVQETKVKNAKIEAHEETIKRKKEEGARKQLENYLLYGGLGISLVFLMLIFNRFQVTRKQKKVIEKEKKRSDELLLNILPESTAEELKSKGSADPKPYDMVTVLFTDFKGFTMISEQLSASELVAEINHCFKAFDAIIGKYGIEKIKTIGDAYMCAGGLPEANKTHPEDVVNAALEIRDFMLVYKQQREREGRLFFEIRLGIHTGPVVAGVVGVKKFAYDIWGDTVNTAARMESSGEVGMVNVSGETYDLIKDEFECTHRGKIEAKNKGQIDMYFTERKFQV
jgi:adenylate cyclase